MGEKAKLQGKKWGKSGTKRKRGTTERSCKEEEAERATLSLGAGKEGYLNLRQGR
jgi:hypothetical protein